MQEDGRKTPVGVPVGLDPSATEQAAMRSSNAPSSAPCAGSSRALLCVGSSCDADSGMPLWPYAKARLGKEDFLASTAGTMTSGQFQQTSPSFPHLDFCGQLAWAAQLSRIPQWQSCLPFLAQPCLFFPMTIGSVLPPKALHHAVLMALDVLMAQTSLQPPAASRASAI